MEKTHNERHNLWEDYAHKAIYNATQLFCSAKGLNFYTEPSCCENTAYKKMLVRLMSPCDNPCCYAHTEFQAVARKQRAFYEGPAKETLVMFGDHIFVCVRIGPDILYSLVKPWDKPRIKRIARENNTFYDLRNVELLYLQEVCADLNNVVFATF